MILTEIAVAVAEAQEGAGGREGGFRARPPRRLPRHIYSHAPAAALTARGAPVQIWQPWEVLFPACLHAMLTVVSTRWICCHDSATCWLEITASEELLPLPRCMSNVSLIMA